LAAPTFSYRLSSTNLTSQVQFSDYPAGNEIALSTFPTVRDATPCKSVAWSSPGEEVLSVFRLDIIQVKDIRQWLNKLAALCQCCAQGKDASRPEGKKRCCAVGKCCHETLSASTRKDARNTLHAALRCAVEDETIARNPVTAVKIAKRREPRQRRKRQAWTVDDARWFLESAWHAGEALIL
jgi:hypothetical protein